ncbi:MAG: ABC transporter substrate-binding protein [Candidatus Nanopelagicales bacterium]
MSRNSRSTMRFAAGLFGLLTLASLGACSSGDSGSDEITDSPAANIVVDEAAAALVPADLKAAGKVTVGSDTTYAPVNFLADDGSTVVGLDIDILDTVLAHLGLTADYVTAPFDNIIPSIQSGKYDMGASAFTITAERQKIVNMISYFNAGVQWAVAAGNPTGITSDTACGKVVAVQRGTVEVPDIEARSKVCEAAGKEKITIDQYQGQDQATASVVSGKSDAMLADSPVTAYAVAQAGGKLETLGDIYDAAPYGWVVPLDQIDLANALQKAATAAKADGSYEAALMKWAAESGAVDEFVVNPKSS